METILPTGKNSGFTLLELLVGIVIMGLVVTAIFASFKMGILSYRKGSNYGDLIRETVGTLNFLQNDLMHMVPSARKTQWKKNSFTFEVLDKDYCKGLCEVTYVFGGGEVIRISKAVSKGGLETSVILIKDLKSFVLGYLVKNAWVAEVKNTRETVIPKAIKLNLNLKRKKETFAISTICNISKYRVEKKRKTNVKKK